MPAPAQRPFLGNFLAAFRAHPQPLPKPQPSISSSPSVATTAAATIWTAVPPQLPKSASPGPEATTATVASPRPIHSKTNPYNSPPTSTATPDRQLLQHNVTPQTHLPRSPPSPGLPIYGPSSSSSSATKSQPQYPSVQDVRRSRRGSDSSNSDAGGFREVRGAAAEKWFIGGLTASGEEKYYKLSMVKRDKSSDRISTDQMSL